MSLGSTSNQSQINLSSLNSNPVRVYEFDRFRLDTAHLMLYEDGQIVALPRKAVETLLALVEKQGEIVGKEELMDRLWADSFVEESNLVQNIYLLRKTMGKGENGEELIQTYRRRGYRFNGDLRPSVDGEMILAVETRTRTIEKEFSIRETPAVDARHFTDSREYSFSFLAVSTAVIGAFLLLAGILAWRSFNGKNLSLAGSKDQPAPISFKRL